MLKQIYPYVLGLFIGIMMLPLFFLGFNLSWGRYPLLGSLMMYAGLFLWPTYVLVILIFSTTTLKADVRRKKQFYHSLYLPFFGGVISLILIALIYRLCIY